MTTYTATYSPDDNKLRLYASSRLDAETYARVKAAGFKWAPKQELFVAPMWTPQREDLLLELAGEIDDEDTTLVDRAEQRAERFEDYSDKRMADANAARDAVAAIADHIPLGQPILVGHHSERRARKDAERIENGMRKAVKMWRTSQYWTARAEGAIRHAKYKELPAVRHRRIKTLTGDLRKCERNRADALDRQQFWLRDDLTIEDVWGHLFNCYTSDNLRAEFIDGKITDLQVIERRRAAFEAYLSNNARWIEHYKHRIAYENAMLAEQIGVDAGIENAMAARFDLKVGGQVLVRDGWLTILRVNKTQGVVSSVTTVAPSSVHWTSRWKYPIERIQDYRAPTEEQTAKVKKATALPPICNYPGEGFREMTEAEWKKRHKWSDFPYVGTVQATNTHGAHRIRQMPAPGGLWKKQQVYITDMKRVDPPAPAPRPDLPAPQPAPSMTGYAAPQPKPTAQDAEFRALQDTLKSGGVQVVTASQLFPTPPDLADRIVQMASITPDHDVLEPSAGTGNLICAIRRAAPDANLIAVEIKPHLADVVRSAYRVPTHCRDFLECNGELGKFDRIVMNPPFEKGSDIRHIQHALKMLKPGGRLVAICANGPRQRDTLKPLATEWHDLPANSFKAAGTSVNTAIVVIDR